MSAEEICKYHGYNYSEFYVKTEDGYINKAFRVNNGGDQQRRPAVLMIHGLIDSGDCWFTNTKEKA
jgi:excinuclease UvrABC helicase subunit UvrB